MEEKKPVILSVDDEKIVLDALYRQLQRKFGNDYLYEFAESGSEAFELMKQLTQEGHRVIVVICDQIMPGITGDKLLTELHASDPRVIKIMLTGQASLESAINVINNANLYRYVTKPWDEQDLLLTIEKGIERYNLYEKTERQLELFQKFVPKEFLNFLYKNNVDISNIKLGDSTETMLTVLFTDIRDYTTLTEGLSPQEAFAFVNAYLKERAPVIRAHNGFINQYIGDGIMALFPRSVDDGVKAVQALYRTLQEFNRKQQELGRPALRVGYGLNTGKAMLGTIGEEERMGANVIGDVINSASRVEALNKTYGTEFLISEFTKSALTSTYTTRLLDKVRVKGKKNAVYIYEVYFQETVDAKERSFIDTYENAFRSYEKGDFIAALTGFKECQKQKSQDVASALLLERTLHLLEKTVPEGWDGTYDMVHK